ncbi:hypothetical protein IFM89_012135 [Coptis chinensis]|uniref:Uncharacterized protein n=1 Tax=Coptis chinensis TaxID=261450 RepID=A0A835I2T1_9MAGN|nr:hypothetical protein IFM89_012135 [Coptis chinensis]
MRTRKITTREYIHLFDQAIEETSSHVRVQTNVAFASPVREQAITPKSPVRVQTLAAATSPVREQANVAPQSPVRERATIASQSPARAHDSDRAHETKSSKMSKTSAAVVGDQSEVIDSTTTSREDSLLTYRNGDSSISRIHSSPVGIIIANSEAEKVLHLLEKKKQKRKRVNKFLLPKALISHSGNNRKRIYPLLGPDPVLGLVIGKNKVAIAISINKFPSITMRCVFWNIRGIANDKSQNRISKIINKWDPDIVGIAEPKILPQDFPINVLHSLGINSAFYSNPNSYLN